MSTREAPDRAPATRDTAEGNLDGQPGIRPPLLIFVHIPKTAGTVVTAILRMNEPGPRFRHGGNVFKGGGGHKAGVKFPRLLKNGSGELDQARVLTGHFPLGLREFLPSELAEERELRFFTFLREPVDRTLSHYFAVREAGRGYDLPPLAADATLEDALGGGYVHDNLQTRMLSGLAEPFGEVDDAMLAQAKRNLREGLAFFGLAERFDESLVLAKQRLGLRSILHRPARAGARVRSGSKSSGRVNTSRPRGDQVPDGLRRAAKRCNRYDIELYRYAEQLFDAAPERSEPDFEIELAALRAARADGEIDLAVPPPPGYGGDEQSWRMLLHARATSLRTELERAELKMLVDERAQRDKAAIRALEQIRAAGKSAPGRDAETALLAIKMLAPGKRHPRADPASATDDRGRSKPGRPPPAGPKRGLRAGRGQEPRKSADA